ncbi:MAG TPA: hypothetical protein PKA43_07190 [Candidatus Competibacter phosphatis]|nr:hypothetical protein [Candidatus Competibacter phosphatis]
MAAIILVHGIAQEQRTADALEAEWLPALAGGVRLAGFPELADRLWRTGGMPGTIDARMAFYGHLFLKADQQGSGMDEMDEAASTLAEPLAREWLARAARQASRDNERRTAAQELAYVERAVGAEEAGAGQVARSAVRSLARLRWFAPLGMAFAERFVVRALAQVSRYFSDETIRQAAVGAVAALVGPETRIVIGHSLGSVVAYEAVQQLTRSLPLLCTLGSPLGLDTIVYPRLRPQPPGFPPRLRRWVNLADRDDLVAAEPDLRPLFSGGLPVGAVFEGDHTVDNGAQPHRPDFYLGKVELGRAVAGALADV